MTIANWIILGLTIISAGLLILGYTKNISILQKVTECLIIPLFGTLYFLILRNYLPDSLHLIKISITALSFITISTVLISFENKKQLRIMGRILVLAGAICWISLYRTIFYIHKVPLWFTLLMLILYIAAIISAIVISGKLEAIVYILFAAGFALSAYLHFCSLIFLCYERSASAVMLFAGTTLFLALTAFHFINQTKLKIKHAGAIRYCLLVASQILIACSNILLIS